MTLRRLPGCLRARLVVVGLVVAALCAAVALALGGPSRAAGGTTTTVTGTLADGATYALPTLMLALPMPSAISHRNQGAPKMPSVKNTSGSHPDFANDGSSSV